MARSSTPTSGLLLREVGLDVLGTARRVVVSKDSTVIVDGGGSQDAIEGRKSQLRAEIEATDSDWDREKLEERLAKLSGGVAVIKVGAATETDLKKRKEAVEDAVSAAKAAVEEGIVTGGGAALVQAGSVLTALRESLTGDEALGVDVFASALSVAAVLDRHQRRAGRLGRGEQGVASCPPGRASTPRR